MIPAEAKLYCVITADVNKSRTVVDRAGLQRRILGVLKEANAKFENDIAVPFTITIGDEWQGLLNSIAPSYQIIDFFRQSLTEISVSYGIGAGQVETSFMPRTSEMDGDAFRRSREALNAAKKTKSEIIFDTNNKPIDALLNSICQLLFVVRSRWTERQKEKITLYKHHQNERKVAEELGVTQGDIHQAIKAGSGKMYFESEERLNYYLITDN